MEIDEISIRPKTLDDKYVELLSNEIRHFFLDVRNEKLRQEIAVWVKCPACDSDAAELYISKDGFQLHRCAACAIVFVNPRPTERSIIEFFAQSKAIDLYSEMVDMTKAARTELIFKPLADLIFETFGGAEGRLLEVGCGSGLLLDALKKENNDWLLKGVEPSGRAVEICRSKGLDVFHGSLEELHDDVGYDLIVFWAVFDHFFDPYRIVKKAHALLKNGGSILIGNMNIEGFDSMVLGEDNSVFSPPERQNFFGETSMSAMLKRAGFKYVRVNTTGKLDVDIIRNYWLAGGKNGRTRFLERLVLGSVSTRDAFQAFLSKNNLSGHMTVIAEKSD